ncbi:MAG: hypothetical protein MUP22_14395, partial [Desulfobacterales bacterium]|nr:hypothetical protein [Desulfobacterales bacterium]
ITDFGGFFMFWLIKKESYLFKKHGLMRKLSNMTPASHSVLRSLALALTALALYVPANKGVKSALDSFSLI